MSELTLSLIPWLLIAGFWIFVIWAVLALISVLKEMLSELRGIGESLRAIRAPEDVAGPEA